MTLLFVNWNGRVGSRLVGTSNLLLVGNDSLHFHHGIELLACLLELLLGSGVVRVGTHSTHCVGARFWAHHRPKTSYHTSLVLNFDMYWVVRVRLPAIGHGSLGASTTLPREATTHLPRWLQNLLSTTATSVHSIVHHTCLVELTVGLSIEGIVLAILVVNHHALGASATPCWSLKVLALGASWVSNISWALIIICYYASTNHSEGTRILALPGSHLLHTLTLPGNLSSALTTCSARRQRYDTTCRFHGAHRQLGKVMVRIRSHGHGVVGRASRLVQGCLRQVALIHLFITLIASTPLLHVCWGVSRHVSVVR